MQSTLGAELRTRLSELSPLIDELQYEFLEMELAASAPDALIEVLTDCEDAPFREMLADALIAQLARTEEAGSFPPVFTDRQLACSIYQAMQLSAVLQQRLPLYYRSALKAQCAGVVE